MKKGDFQHELEPHTNTLKILHGLCGCTVYVDNIKSFICPTNAHTNYFKIIKQLKKLLKITTLAPLCFGLHKPSSANS